jgi:hypothetical protein
MFKYHLPDNCSYCGEPIYQGFARCQKCGKVRPEFDEHNGLVKDNHQRCVFSGSETDVVLPNGQGIWAPYLFDLINRGYLDSQYGYTAKYFKQTRSRNL